MKLNYVVMDVETYWAADYTLSKMTSEEYIRDPRFKDHGWGVMPIGEQPMWLRPHTMQAWAAEQDWASTAIVCHNTRFDGAILGWKYGIKPRLWIDTMGIYRALYPSLKRFSLGALGKHFAFGEKGDCNWTLGRRDLTATEWEELGRYCAGDWDSDCRITARLFEHGWPKMPAFERMVMDMTLRMYIEPIFEVDQPVLSAFLTNHMQDKQKLLDDCGLTRDAVMSNGQFAALLERLDVEPPMKPSPTNPDKLIFAFAKTDAAMDELAEHDDPRVQVLVAARLGNKSTQLETRTRRIIDIGSRGTLPIPLNYWGAKITGRHSGADKINMQNFTRGSTLREGVVAPPGYKVVVGDSSNIELRLVMAAAGQLDAVAKIRAGVDLYCDFASAVYGRPITKADTDERFVGKQGMLSLQYMASAVRFGNMMRQKKHPLADIEAERVKDVYRRKHHRVVKLWYYCEETVIPAIAERRLMVAVDVNGWFLTNDGGFSLPGELGVQYPRLKRAYNTTTGKTEWTYDTGRGRQTLYGAKVVENGMQHAARQVVMFQGLLVQTRYPVKHSVHDELVCCVPEDDAEDCAAFMLQCLQTAPKWARGLLPVTGEVGIGDSYGAAK